MSIGRNTLLFFDASCLIAAAGSPTGGSGFLLTLCIASFLQASASQSVLIEAERHVLTDLGPGAIETYRHIISNALSRVVPFPTADELLPYEATVNEKDRHVVASVMASGAAFLISLDRRLIEEVNRGGLPATALLPGDFIKAWLPQHSDYPGGQLS